MNGQTLQSLFYVIGIIYMTLYTILLIVMVILLFYIKTKITNLIDTVEERIKKVKDIVYHPKELAATVGAAVAGTAIEQVTKLTHRKKRKP